MVSTGDDREVVYSVSFNQNQDQFAVATNKGFQVYSMSSELIRCIKREFKGGLSVVQMLGMSNILLLVATGENPDYPSTNVMIWDDKQLAVINHVEFLPPIKSLSYNCEMYMVGTAESILCMTLDGHNKVHEIVTKFNEKGLHAIS